MPPKRVLRIVVPPVSNGNNNIRGIVPQVIRKDVLQNILLFSHLPTKELLQLLLNENTSQVNESRRGFIYETLCIILIVTKCVVRLQYAKFMDGQLQNLRPITNIMELLSKKINSGNNPVDITIKIGSTLIPISVKYENKYSHAQISDIDNTIKTQNITDDYKIGLIVKNKEFVENHNFSNNKNIHKEQMDMIQKNDLLFDERDIMQAIDVFREKFDCVNYSNKIDDFVEFVNEFCLLSPRSHLFRKMHQQLAYLRFIDDFTKNNRKMWCISHKMRSGKSITILLLCKYLTEQRKTTKILIMTSVPSTIDSFIADLEKWIEFRGMSYKRQEDFEKIEANFTGILFCSTQFLKTSSANGKPTKKDMLENIGFDVIITDESHQGSSTEKTRTDILENADIHKLQQNAKICIFSSGTSTKTRQYYGITNSFVYEWEMMDEANMKLLMQTDITHTMRQDILQAMTRKHGKYFMDCYENGSLDRDYSIFPCQVLMKHIIPSSLQNDITKYNREHGTNYGYNCSSLFALKQTINPTGKLEYTNEFDICKDADGKEIMMDFMENIISQNKMKDTIMKQVEHIQTERNSRKSTTEDPKLFIIYLPTNTRNNTIAKLQQTFKQFIQDNNLWKDFAIEYSNATEDTGDVSEEYNQFIQTIMQNTRKKGKRGCILLLGNKGTVGVTYDDCDVTISLDDGHNLDNNKQKFARSHTPAPNKTIGINIDMNIQRTYLHLLDTIQSYRKYTKSTASNAEILQYLFTYNLFLFDRSFNPYKY
jgi:hypothetical protein